jgi:hypothetical protein
MYACSGHEEEGGAAASSHRQRLKKGKRWMETGHPIDRIME